jgi:hypothetical protein
MSSINLLRWGGRSAILGEILRGINSFLPIAIPTLVLELMYFSMKNLGAGDLLDLFFPLSARALLLDPMAIFLV